MGYPACFGSLGLVSISPNCAILYQAYSANIAAANIALMGPIWHIFDTSAPPSPISGLKSTTRPSGWMATMIQQAPKLNSAIVKNNYGITSISATFMPFWHTRGVSMVLTPQLITTVVESTSESHHVNISIDASCNVITFRTRLDHRGEKWWCCHHFHPLQRHGRPWPL